jgi:hypothetical protein
MTSSNQLELLDRRPTKAYTGAAEASFLVSLVLCPRPRNGGHGD